ncbi:MAG: glycosyltransferase family 4 protein [Verrucomicrobia bacterium]|nr:glycosyltransferase family 4 protein [Verrucomicrobiota bacterium]
MAIIAFMECQLEHGLDVRAVGPLDAIVPEGPSLPVEHLPLKEFNLATDDFCSKMLAEAGDGPAIFHFHGLSPWSDRLAEHLRQASVPYVFTSHGQLHFHGPVHGLKKFVYLNFINAFIRDAAGLHFLTRYEKERSRFILPRWRKPVLVQPNLVRLPETQSIVPAVRASLGIPADAFVFTYLGRLDVQHKGLDFLMEAFAGASKDTDSRLVLIGPDFAGGRQFLEQLARKCGCENKVHFPGPQIGAVKWQLLKMADAFVSPSRWECCSIAQAEAIGLGLPTIVSDEINIAPEMLENHAALVAPLQARALAGAMRRLMNDAALQKALAAAGQEWVKGAFSFEKAGPRFMEFYNLALFRSGRPGPPGVCG